MVIPLKCVFIAIVLRDSVSALGVANKHDTAVFILTIQLELS